jgi:hypothetical protein
MSNVDRFKHAVGRLEGLLHKGSVLLEKGASPEEYLQWRRSMLHCVEQYFGAGSQEHQTIQAAFMSVEDRHDRGEESDVTPIEITNGLKVVASILYKYLSRIGTTPKL